MTPRHLLIRAEDGRTLVVNERTGMTAGALVELGRTVARTECALMWAWFALWLCLGIVVGVLAEKAGGW